MSWSLSDVRVAVAGSPWLLLLLVIVGVGAAAFVYRRTNPVVSHVLRRILLTLRALSLLAIILLVFRPTVELWWAKREKPLLPVLVDNSASMALTDDSGPRPAQVARVLASQELRSLAARARMPHYLFSTGLHGEFKPDQDSLRLDGLGTNLDGALAELRDRLRGESIAGVIIITDGAANMGERVVRLGAKSDVPLYPVAIGSSKQPQDLIVHSVAANEVSYVGSEVPVQVRLLNRGFERENVVVELRADGQLLASRVVSVQGTQPEAQVTLQFTPQVPGVRRYVVSASRLPGEQTYENNRAEFVVKVLASKMKVVVLAGRPSHDAAFLGRALEADANVEPRLYICRKGSGFYRAPAQRLSQALSEADCLFLVEFPGPDTDPAVVAEVNEAVRARHLPLFWAGGEDIDWARLSGLWEWLPLSDMPRQQSPELRGVKLQGPPPHALFAVKEDGAGHEAAWEELPPVVSSLQDVPLWPNSEVIAVGLEATAKDVKRAVPLIVVRVTPESRSVALLAAGFWRWDMMMWGIGKDNSLYLSFVKNLVRWLSLREEQKLFRVRTDREFYRSGETVVFMGQLYGPDLRPLEGAQVRLKVTGAGASKEIGLEATGPGRYEGRWTAEADGDYDFVATAQTPSGVALADTGRLSVSRWSVEFLSTAARPEDLEQMAASSGGALAQWDDLTPLRNIRLPQVTKRSRVQLRYQSSGAVLALIIALLGSEWLLRRRKGMV